MGGVTRGGKSSGSARLSTWDSPPLPPLAPPTQRTHSTFVYTIDLDKIHTLAYEGRKSKMENLGRCCDLLWFRELEHTAGIPWLTLWLVYNSKCDESLILSLWVVQLMIFPIISTQLPYFLDIVLKCSFWISALHIYYMNRWKPKGVFPAEILIRSFSWE